MIVSYTQRKKRTVFYNLLKKDCTTFTSRVTLFNENTVRTEGIQITLYFLMSSISHSNTVTMHALETFVFIFSLQFQLVSNTVTVHALLTLLSFFRCSFKYRHSACFRDIVFKRFLQFPIFSNTVRIHLCSFKSVQIHSECIL